MIRDKRLYSKDKSKNFSQQIVEILIIIAILYNSGSVLTTIDNRIGFVLMLFTMMIMFLSKPMIKLRIKLNFLNTYFAVSLLVVLISMLINGNFSYIENNIRYSIILIYSFYFVKNVSFNTFVDNYTKVMSFLVTVSVIPFYLINLLKVDLLRYLPIIENINGVRYYNGFLFYFYTYSHKRNMGIFWEPAIFSSFIIVAMLYEICYKKPSIPRLGILLIGLISTGSTGGFLLFPFIIMIYLFKNSNVFSGLFIQLSLVIVGIWTFLYIDLILNFLNKVNPLVFGKFFRENSASVFERSSSPLVNLDLFLQNPIFGNGLGRADDMYSNFMISQTSTSTYYLAAFGLFGVMYTMSILYGSLKQKRFNLIIRALVFIIFILIVNKEPHARILLTHIMVFYLIKSEKEQGNYNT